MPSQRLVLLAEEYAICRLPSTERIPAWSQNADFFSIVRTAEELSVLCPAAGVPAEVRHERGWRLLKFQGPFALSETGIMVGVLEPLAKAGVAILALSTFDTDYVLVKADRLSKAREVLAAAGHAVQP